ncbi:WPP domain-associated protein [Zea mays]|uniref:WPP domain-associated protein n=1 Tax=Zea mays TaxID=4577 RepID=A0A1D6HCI9_MAIZE|nr:WPP domain-associated protein [Zea mays]
MANPPGRRVLERVGQGGARACGPGNCAGLRDAEQGAAASGTRCRSDARAVEHSGPQALHRPAPPSDRDRPGTSGLTAEETAAWFPDTLDDPLEKDLESYALPSNGRAIRGAHLGMSLDVMLIEIDERNWKEAITQFAAMREDLGALCKLLLPLAPEAHISNGKNESPGSKSNRWKYNFFGKKSRDDRSPRAEDNKSFRKQKSFGAKDVISEKSDFHHLNGMTREQVITYFKSEISKMKRMHKSALQEKTEELFRLKREKGSHSLKNDIEFEPLRKKIPELVLRMDQIISKNIKVPAICMTHDELDERCRLMSRIDALFYENQHFRGLLADRMKDIKALSSRLSEASIELSMQMLSEEELLRQIDKVREDCEDLRIECDIREGMYQTVTKHLLDDYKDNMDGAALNLSAKLSSLESAISEKDEALCLYNEENHSDQEVPEAIKQDSTEIVLRDIEVEPCMSPRRSNADDSRSEELSDHCNHMVRQAMVLTKIGLWYKQMIEARRSELQKAEAKLLDAFMKTCKLVADLRSKQNEGDAT